MKLASASKGFDICPSLFLWKTLGSPSCQSLSSTCEPVPPVNCQWQNHQFSCKFYAPSKPASSMSSSLYKDEPTTNIIPSLCGLGSLTWAVHVKYWWNSCARIKWYSALLRLEEWLLVEKTLGNRVEDITQYNSYSMPLYLPSSSLLLPDIYRDSYVVCNIHPSPNYG